MDEAFPKHHSHIQRLLDDLSQSEKEVLLDLSKKLGLSLNEKNDK